MQKLKIIHPPKPKLTKSTTLKRSMILSHQQEKNIQNTKRNDQFQKKRQNEHKMMLKNTVTKLEQYCQEYGGIQRIQSDLRRQLIDGEIKNTNNNNIINKPLQHQARSYLELPKVKKKQTHSQPKLKSYNKWYMPAKDRFSSPKQQIKYQQFDDKFIFSILKKKFTQKHQFMPYLIEGFKKKVSRDPVFYNMLKINLQ